MENRKNRNFMNMILKCKELVYLIVCAVFHYTCCLHLLPSPTILNLWLWNTVQYCCLHGAVVCIVCICLVLSLEQKCKDTLHAMHRKMSHPTDLDSPKKNEVSTAIKKWQEYFYNLKEHELKFQVCD